MRVHMSVLGLCCKGAAQNVCGGEVLTGATGRPKERSKFATKGVLILIAPYRQVVVEKEVKTNAREEKLCRQCFMSNGKNEASSALRAHAQWQIVTGTPAWGYSALSDCGAGIAEAADDSLSHGVDPC